MVARKQRMVTAQERSRQGARDKHASGIVETHLDCAFLTTQTVLRPIRATVWLNWHRSHTHVIHPRLLFSCSHQPLSFSSSQWSAYPTFSLGIQVYLSLIPRLSFLFCTLFLLPLMASKPALLAHLRPILHNSLGP